LGFKWILPYLSGGDENGKGSNSWGIMEIEKESPGTIPKRSNPTTCLGKKLNNE